MKLAFTKMNGLGNDFMVLPWPSKHVPPAPELVRRWADRRRGVGFDQLLLVDSEQPEAGDASYRILNADGGEVEQCGNGARCLARYLGAAVGQRAQAAEPRRRRRSARRVAATESASISACPTFARPRCRSRHPPSATVTGSRSRVATSSSVPSRWAIRMPCSPSSRWLRAEVELLGPAFQRHASFPQSVNVGFMERQSERRIRLRVFERGVGETLACGTGAAAAVAVGRRWGWLGEKVEVELPGGVLEVNWPGPGAPLWQTGPTTAVYEGYIEL